MKSGFDPTSYEWESEYYAELRAIEGGSFLSKTFAAGPALVSRFSENGSRITQEYLGQAYDPGRYDLIAGAWTHSHCRVCRFRLEVGHSYWETPDRVWCLCDECYGYLQRRSA